MFIYICINKVNIRTKTKKTFHVHIYIIYLSIYQNIFLYVSPFNRTIR